MSKTPTARPFVKWAGGKTQLLPALCEIMPQKIRTYYEPFLGGGAVFFALAAQGRFERAVLNDSNEELIDTFRVVRDFPAELMKALRTHQSNEWNTAAYFDRIRRQDPQTLTPVDRAARMIYLNKTCFNGLFRVNRKGEFNVPFGRYKNPTLFEEVNLLACSKLLERVANLQTTDFVEAIHDVGPGDVVYFDPPYIPISATSNFASYTTGGFGLNDHYRLAALFKQVVASGAFVLLSNSETSTTRALYSGFEVRPVTAKRHINSKGDRRGPVGELIIVGREAVQDVPIPVPDLALCLDCGETFPAELTTCASCGSANMTLAETMDTDEPMAEFTP